MSGIRVTIGPVPPDTMTGDIPVRIDIWPRTPAELAEKIRRDLLGKGPCPKCARAMYGLACDEHTERIVR